ncbi:hypothetical protein K469DRAFT_698339 [Zopfia rhizophila CBS 207.26]|uniref:Ecp2 effector protein domain-containing protein n=1 Tax=Zopfia rhizophila CBS 207.26 TaxID=1314779 RepID=A0A6A6DC20_9PEZI|nr:hypothetical protein K469DRAFT_698339 [Zopfia rhizophila CBS 207.26]
MLGSFSLLPLLPLLSNGSPITSPQSTTVVPIEIRECFLGGELSLVQPFASYLRSSQQTTLIKKNMGREAFRRDFNGTCIQIQINNWSCDYDLDVTGPGLANAVESIAEQCDGRKRSDGKFTGPAGWGYYKDVETGHDYTQHLWAILSGCDDWKPKSACSPGAY